MANVVGERYQITIDKAVREQLGIKPGDRAVERVENGRLVVDFVPKPHSESLRGILHRPGMAPITDWHAVRDRAWDLRVAEIQGRIDLAECLVAFLSRSNVVLTDADQAGAIAAIRWTTRASARRIPDALLAVAAEHAGCDWIATFDERMTSPTVPVRAI